MASENKHTRRSRRVNEDAESLPDPRPVTEYTVVLSTVGINARLTVTLGQPCVVRQPAWAFVNVSTGARVLTTLIHQLHRTGGKRGLAALCLGGGNAVAMIVEV